MGFKKYVAAAGAAALASTMILATPASATNIGNEGCTPGYWKNHLYNWQEYSPATPLQSKTDPGKAFQLGQFSTKYGSATFGDALSFQGGSGLDGAFQILMRASVAAFLNAAHEGVGYPLRRFSEPGTIQADVNAALASGSRAQMLALATQLDGFNNLGCPLNNTVWQPAA
jgi:hypothetical protein